MYTRDVRCASAAAAAAGTPRQLQPTATRRPVQTSDEGRAREQKGDEGEWFGFRAAAKGEGLCGRGREGGREGVEGGW